MFYVYWELSELSKGLDEATLKCTNVMMVARGRMSGLVGPALQ